MHVIVFDRETATSVVGPFDIPAYATDHLRKDGWQQVRNNPHYWWKTFPGETQPTHATICPLTNP
jgi:hypothetical protein